eukprot:COSAG06_NODE_12180_length_1412_cov_1.850724_2_plen_60_part_00
MGSITALRTPNETKLNGMAVVVVCTQQAILERDYSLVVEITLEAKSTTWVLLSQPATSL